MFISQNKRTNHNFFMRLALNQARKNIGNTNENPSVGCVIVKNNNIISAGCTSITGRPHAEYNAIKSSKNNLTNSDLYVTIEPCSHYGKTPPCVKNIIKKKIKRVFFSLRDPDPKSFDKSKKILNRNGIYVVTDLIIDEVTDFYRSYTKVKTRYIPFVTAKMAISKDFYTINKNRKKWITNKYSRGRVHLMRSNHDCIITSSKTVMKDNPRFTCRIEGLNERTPSRIILDKKLKVSVNSTVIKDAKIYKTIIFYNIENNKKIELLKKHNVRVLKIPINKSGNLDLKIVLSEAMKLGFTKIFLESGLTLFSSFLKENLIDDFELFISDKKLENNGKNSIKKYLNFLTNKKCKYSKKVNLFGDELISYNLK